MMYQVWYIILTMTYIVILEATLHNDDVIQELQQQLKAEQKMKSNMARELDMLKTQQHRQGVETKDAAVQCSYLQTVSGTITLYHCNSM